MTAESAAARHAGGHGEEPFVLTAILSLVGATLWMALRPRLLADFFYSPEHLALTHLVTLGFLTSLMMGVLVRLAPMTLGIAPRSRRSVLVQYVLFLVGASGMVVHFRLGRWPGLAWATLLVLAATLLQLAGFRQVWAKARAGDWVARHVAAALVQLPLGAALGVAYAMQNAYGVGAHVWRAPFVPRLGAHATLLAVGWVAVLIFGFELKLVPTTARGQRSRGLRFALLEVGMWGLVLNDLAGASSALPFALLLLVAFLWQAAGPLRGLTRHPDWAGEAAALTLLTAAGLLATALALGWPEPASPYRLRVSFAAAYLGILGFATQTIAGIAFKLFPLWVWRERFEPDWGKKPVPRVADLASRKLRDFTSALLFAGVAATAAGIATAELRVLRVATWLVFAGAVAFTVHFVRVARWKLLR